ncbi:MAG: alpha/beta fold hydrolase [Actinomycetota bacterium]|nr:alpha/beta fold hydrolase [Actinomycetota bacterium]
MKAAGGYNEDRKKLELVSTPGTRGGDEGNIDIAPDAGTDKPPDIPPCFFVHGYASTPAHSCILRARLRGEGLVVRTARLPWMAMGDIARSAEVVAEQVEEMKRDLGVERVNLIGHSLGGVIIRYYLQKMEGWRDLKRVVYLATPFHGSYLAYLTPLTKAGRQLHPGSDFITCMEREGSRCRKPRCLSIYSMLDYITIPHTTCHLDCAYNQKVWLPAGHLGLLLSKRAVEWTTDFLQGKLNGAMEPMTGRDGRDIAC